MTDGLPVVLLVDDEVRSLDAMRRTLDEDFLILTAESAEAARDMLAQREVAVILCDQRMPGLTGVAFLKEARERWPDTVRIVISGYTDSEDIIAGINEAGIYQYILKPWVPDHLLASVRGAAEARALQGSIKRLDIELRSPTAVLRQRSVEKLDKARQLFGFDRIERAVGAEVATEEALLVMNLSYNDAVVTVNALGPGGEVPVPGLEAVTVPAGSILAHRLNPRDQPRQIVGDGIAEQGRGLERQAQRIRCTLGHQLDREYGRAGGQDSSHGEIRMERPHSLAVDRASASRC